MENPVIRLTEDLIRINSENPGSNEYKIGRFVKTYFDRLGLAAKLYEFSPRRTNVVAVLKNASSSKSLLITPHLDTVPAGKNWKNKPFAPEIKNGKLFGLGSTDCKGNLAVAMEAVKALVTQKARLGYNLIFAATSDEETGSALGLMKLLERNIIRASAAVVLDSDDFRIITAQKGLMHLKFIFSGIKAHAAYPYLGINAIDLACKAIKEIKDFQFKIKKHPLLSPPTVNIGTIQGGDKVNVVADWCFFEADLRFLPRENPEEILRQVKSAVHKNAGKFKLEIEGVQKPFEIEKSHPLVQGFMRAMRNNKISPVIEGSEGATVVSFFDKYHIPSIATGFGSSGCAHICDEYVKISNLVKGVEVLSDFLRNYKFN
ncbi:MAG: M20 family metallopeptidase [Candidatus Omnitrophica bacterium]|nr:M20 family metallopeptidase [Candidatus Omnitrophota bacterium]